MIRPLRLLPFFWKMFAAIVVLLSCVVGLVEGVLEPLVEAALGRDESEFSAWHELILWIVSIVIPAIISGYLLSKALSDKLRGMVHASNILAMGDLSARLPVKGDDHDDFDILARAFNEMADAIETQLRNERRLLGDISHELRSPLTRMALAVEILKRRQDGDCVVLQRLENEVAHMSDLVALLLTQAKERASKRGATESVDLEGLLGRLADDYEFEGNKQSKHIKLNTVALPPFRGDVMLLRRVLGNLISNALFYTPEGGVVEVSGWTNEDGICISVRDFGPGVPQNQLESIFRAFYRVDDSRARTSGGVGLGLALAKEAAIRLGGDIIAENAEPGLRLIVSLPLSFEMPTLKEDAQGSQ